MPTDPPYISLADAARTLVVSRSTGVLSTLGSEGAPYGSLVETLPLANGHVVFFLSTLATHTQHLLQDPRVSLHVAEVWDVPAHMLASPRATLIGSVERVDDRQRFRDAYLERHPHAAQYIDFGDFHFFRLIAERVRFIAGFGRMGWLDGTRYHAADVDPLWAVASGAIEHMNEDHAHNMLEYIEAFTRIDDARAVRMLRLDRLGFDVRVQRPAGAETVRLAFPEPVDEPGRLRHAMVDMTMRARAVLKGEPSPD